MSNELIIEYAAVVAKPVAAAPVPESRQLADYRNVFGHLGATADEAGNVLAQAQDDLESRIEDLQHALRLTVRAIQNLLPGGVNHPQANHGLINEAILTSRASLRAEKPDA